MKKKHWFFALFMTAVLFFSMLLPVYAAAGIAGDIDNDGKVGNKDAILLFRHVAGWQVNVDPDALDVTGDNKVNNKDAIILFRYVAGWPNIELHRKDSCTHQMTHVPGKAATCTENGVKEHWICSVCGGYFLDAEGTKATDASAVVIPATGHQYSDKWTYDTEEHWHEPICADKEKAPLKDSAPHTFVNHVCSVCGCKETFAVTFVDYDGTELDVQLVEYGGFAVKPEDPARAGYRFDGWDKAFANITGNITVKARYIKEYTVRFRDADGTLLKTETVLSGADATPPQVPDKKEYDFTGWSETTKGVMKNMEVYAKYTIKTFQVTFRMPDGTVIPYIDSNGIKHDSQTVEYGGTAVAPEYSDVFTELYFDTRPGYGYVGEFASWSKANNSIRQNTDIYAIYRQYEAPVLIFEKTNDDGKSLMYSIQLYLPKSVYLYAIDLNLDWGDRVGIKAFELQDTAGTLYTQGDKTTWNEYHSNKEKNAHFMWTNGNGYQTDYKWADIGSVNFQLADGITADKAPFTETAFLVYGTKSNADVSTLKKTVPIVLFR